MYLSVVSKCGLTLRSVGGMITVFEKVALRKQVAL